MTQTTMTQPTMTRPTMNNPMDWNALSQEWRQVEVDTSACMQVVHSVGRRTRLMLSGVILEAILLVLVVGLIFFLQRFLPTAGPLMIWAWFGLAVSVASVVFRVRNTAGLWRSQAESTRQMLALSHKRLEAIARTAQFNRGLTQVFVVALVVWGAGVWWLRPDIWTARPVITVGVLAFVTVWLAVYWVFNRRSLERCREQLAAIDRLREEFSDG
jgi:hypothetical protein